MLVVEVEDVQPTGSWVSETTFGGYTGSSYYRWAGPDLFNSPGQGVLTYDFEIQNPGTYRLAVRNRHQHPDSSLENDMWVRMDGGNWVKSYSNSGNGSVNQWNWFTKFEIGSSHQEPDFQLGTGMHTIEFSGRSKNFMIDRFHLTPPFHPNANDASVTPSKCAGGGGGVPPATVYCTPKVNSMGCTPAVSVPDDQPSMSASGSFMVLADQILNRQTGMFFYGYKEASTPFQGGTFCMLGPVRRTPVQVSGGSGTPGTNCSGRMSYDVNAHLASGVDPLLGPGVNMFGQFWYRDSQSPGGSGLTDAAAMNIQP